MAAHDLLDGLLDALADRIAARMASPPGRQGYSSRELPPRTTRRRFAEVCRSGRVADARRDGGCWECSRAAWELARRRAPTTAHSAEPREHAVLDRADRLLARAGLRVVPGARS